MKKSEAKGSGDKNVAFIWHCGCFGHCVRSPGWQGAQAVWRGQPGSCVLLSSALNRRMTTENTKAEVKSEKEIGKNKTKQTPSSVPATHRWDSSSICCVMGSLCLPQGEAFGHLAVSCLRRSN